MTQRNASPAQRENRWQFAARTSVAMRLFEPYAAPFVFLQRNPMANDITRAAGELLHLVGVNGWEIWKFLTFFV
jgi:hypothetical protein